MSNVHTNIYLPSYISVSLTSCAACSGAAALCLAPDLDLLTLKVVSESRVTCYLCANFSLPRPLCSRLRPDVRDRRQTRIIAYAPVVAGA